MTNIPCHMAVITRSVGNITKALVNEKVQYVHLLTTQQPVRPDICTKVECSQVTSIALPHYFTPISKTVV